MEPPPPPDHHFAPLNPEIHILDDPIDDTFADPTHYEERRPTIQQRMSAMSIHDDVYDIQQQADYAQPIDLPLASQDYLYYRLTKRGEDWSSAVKATISAPSGQIEKKAKKGKGGDGPILEQMTRMPRIRRDQIEEVVRAANAHETGETRWEVAYIKAKKLLKRNGRLEVPEMDIILARSRAKTRPRSRLFGEEVVGGHRGSPNGVHEKKYVDDHYIRVRKDSVLAPLTDPIRNLPVFDHDGRSRDEFGPVHLNNAGLPPQIPQEQPLGTRLESKKEDKGKRDKSQKRSKSRERRHAHEDAVVFAGDMDDFIDGVDPASVDEVKTDKRGRRGKSPQAHSHPEIIGVNATRSHSRRRGPNDGHGQLREKSRSRRDSVHFPNQHTRQYFNESVSPSEASDSSHYGFEYAESSNTSLGTPGGVPRRGSLVHNNSRPDTVYKEHHRGPARSLSYSERPYNGGEQTVIPARSHRNSYVTHERPADGARGERSPRLLRQMTTPIPEDRQAMYREVHPSQRTLDVVPLRRISDAPVMRYVPRDAGVPILHYPDEERDFYIREEIERRHSRVEDYQREAVRDEYLKHRERDVSARERYLDIREDDVRRLRRDHDREYLDERDIRQRRASRQLYYDDHPGDYY